MNRFNPGPPKQPTGDPTSFLDQDDPLEDKPEEVVDTEAENRLTPDEEAAESKLFGEQIRQLLMYSPKEDTPSLGTGPISRATAYQPIREYYDRMAQDYSKGVAEHGYTGVHKNLTIFRQHLYEQAKESGDGLTPEENLTDSAVVLDYRLNGLHVSLDLPVGTRAFIPDVLWNIKVTDEQSNQRSQYVLRYIKDKSAGSLLTAYSKPYGEHPPPDSTIEENYLSLDIREACEFFHKVLANCIQLAIEQYDPKANKGGAGSTEPPEPRLDV